MLISNSYTNLEFFITMCTIVNSHYLNTALFEDLLYDQYLFPLVRCDQLINCYQFHKEILILSFFITMSLSMCIYIF